ncbi:hypothetical protein ACNKHM_20690 [Shigella sonnei]
MGGNVAPLLRSRPGAASPLASSVKLGYRPGLICTTRIVTGVGFGRSPPSPTPLTRWKALVCP